MSLKTTIPVSTHMLAKIDAWGPAEDADPLSLESIFDDGFCANVFCAPAHAFGKHGPYRTKITLSKPNGQCVWSRTYPKKLLGEYDIPYGDETYSIAIVKR